MSLTKTNHCHTPAPCKTCPFRKEGGVRLAKSRIREIIDMIGAVKMPRANGGQGGRFPCHKTVDRDDEGETTLGGGRELECAGALILLYKLEGPGSNFIRIMERLGMVDRALCDEPHPEVFDTVAQMLRTALR